MIRAGRTAADDARAAQLLGKALGTYRNTKAHQQLTDALTSRPGARTRIYDEELLGLLVPLLVEGRRPSAMEAEAVARIRRTISEAPDCEQDLLDAEEAWHAMPSDDRPSLSSWRSYLSNGVGPAPDAVVAGVAHYRRATISTWCADRPRVGQAGGRPPGSTDKTPRDFSGDPRHHRAEQRRARVREFLAVHPRPGGTALTGLANELGISLRHAERLVAEARGDAAG